MATVILSVKGTTENLELSRPSEVFLWGNLDFLAILLELE